MTDNASAQAYVADPRNEDVLIYVNGDLVPRNKAVVSVFDSGFVLGDGVWEGLRVKKGRIIQLDAHLGRLFEGAGSIALDIGRTRDEIEAAIRQTLEANSMEDGVHIRLMVTRGMKSTPNQDPRFLIGKATLVIVAEYKAPRPEAKAKGLSLFTSTFRTSGPDVFDLRLNSHSRLNLIQALIQAINAGADEALMLDPRGFVASCNSTNFFVVRGREIWTSTGSFSFKGLTQRATIDAWRDRGELALEKDFTLAEAYSADEAFITGTLGGITPVVRIDGRVIGAGRPGPVTAEVNEAYQQWVMR
ncbi:aminotransferase class IV [Nitratireductor mangrovi]|uniref:Probable branched-chain-amino-acid aminotransferase n=1 Tax=Nitratireductor mangrovi TaxID=2599600 RepID=A0A5B8KTK3_9HYPH|nr:aminotransferase class IV [Nitratireductor mangrovi]QDY98936.1 aminotransferase class IV [Nitratireductor mangrovi]